MESLSKAETPITVDVEGLDDFFGQPGGQTVANATNDLAADGHLVATISEASRLLQIPYSSLRRQIKQGKFKTLTGADGKPRVLIEATAATTASQMVATAFQAATTSGQPMASPDLTKLLELVERQSKELQGASCRIGWLESQLQEREKEIKLLTDSQHKSQWWRRAWSWLRKER